MTTSPIGWTAGTAVTGHYVTVKLAEGVSFPVGTPLYAAPPEPAPAPDADGLVSDLAYELSLFSEDSEAHSLPRTLKRALATIEQQARELADWREWKVGDDRREQEFRDMRAERDALTRKLAAYLEADRRTRKEWCGRDYDHLPLWEAVGLATQARERQSEERAERAESLAEARGRAVDAARTIVATLDYSRDNADCASFDAALAAIPASAPGRETE